MAFTEHGVAMLSGVLNSDRAIYVNIQIIRTFILMRKAIINNKQIKNEIEKYHIEIKNVSNELLKQGEKVEQHDEELEIIIKTIEKMLNPEVRIVEKIGFKIKKVKK